MKILVQHLIIFENNNSNFNGEMVLEKLQKTGIDVAIDPSFIKYKNRFEYKYEIEYGVGKDENRFFLTKLFFEREAEDFEDEKEDITALFETVKGLIHNTEGQPRIFWSDISFYYPYTEGLEKQPSAWGI